MAENFSIKPEDVLDLSEEEREAYYDIVIAPKLAEIAKDSAIHGMPFIALVQYSDRALGESTLFLPNVTRGMRAVYDLLRLLRIVG